MSNYEDLPCSIYQAPRVVELAPKPRVFEVTPSPPEESRRRSCLSAPHPRREVPHHPGAHQKTVAFGKTVNVSQTVEATSRATRKAMNSATTTSAMNLQNALENREDVLRIVKDELAATRLAIQEESARKMEELNEQNMKTMQEMMSSFFQQIVVAQPQITEKPQKPKPMSKISMARQKIQKEGRIPMEALPILERRLQNDPLFRQKVDDVLAEAEYEVDENDIRRYSPPPQLSSAYPPSPMYTGGANPSKMMRETVTVARSIRFDNGLESIDQRRTTTHWSDRGGRIQKTSQCFGCSADRYRSYSPDPVLQSTYQPGNSISYYPSDRRDDHETREERERRIREKYTRKK